MGYVRLGLVCPRRQDLPRGMLPDPVSCKASWIWHTRKDSMDIFQAMNANYMRLYTKKKKIKIV